jgi:hypothetical protein
MPFVILGFLDSQSTSFLKDMKQILTIIMSALQPSGKCRNTDYSAMKLFKWLVALRMQATMLPAWFFFAG